MSGRFGTYTSTPAVEDRLALETIGRPAASHQVMYTITVG
jgi:hypothetical protein